MYRGNTDANQKQIVKDLRSAGYSVISLHGVGSGVPDLLIADSQKYWLVEIKVPGGRLSATQEDFMLRWRGPKIHICTSTEEVLSALCSK